MPRRDTSRRRRAVGAACAALLMPLALSTVIHSPAEAASSKGFDGLSISLQAKDCVERNDCVERIALQEINQERRQRGLDRLRFDARLNRAAEDHTRHMARTGRYGHSGIGDGTPTERVRRAGFGGYSKEVLGHSYITPSDMVLAWMGSREHRQMLMKPRMDHIGIAREFSKVSKRPYWTAVVGDVNRR